MIKIAEILLPLPIDQLFSYTFGKNTSIFIGDYVIVPFGKKHLIGIVWRHSKRDTDQKLKVIESKINILNIRPKLISFACWVADYNLMPIGLLAKLIMGGVLKINQLSKLDKLVYIKGQHKICKTTYQLSREQKIASDKIIKNLHAYSVTLLDGETGSGKTEVYLSIITELINATNSAQILVLLPEIILITQLASRICNQISGNLVAEWHSGLTLKTRRNNWLGIVNGNIRVIIGARSSLFLPYKNLKLIIIDEEHDSSFKQEQNYIYNARDMAIILAKIENIPVILSSATPLLETIYHVKNGKYCHIKLSKRFGGAELPLIKVIDMRNKKKWISEELFSCVKETIEKKQQAMLFLNRRGYAQLAVCKNCGYKIFCPNCSIWLTYHRLRKVLLCHYCFYQLNLPETCSNCQSKKSLHFYGVGIERLFERMIKLIPDAKTLIISSDQKSINNVIDLVVKEKVNIVIGTQIIAKGHNFPKLTLVGVVNADLSLENSDLRAAEKTYQLLHQVAGRSGRFKEKGTVIVQTDNPESPIIKALQHQKRDQFYETELKSRRKAKMPPFSRLISLIICGKNRILTQEAANKIARFLHNQCLTKEFEILGSSSAAISLLNNKYRFRILLKIYNKHSLSIHRKLKHWIKSCNMNSTTKIVVDVDPISFM